MKSYGQFIDKSIALDESIVGRYFDSSRFGPGGNKNVTTGLKPNVPTVRQQQKTKPNNPTKPPLRATSQRPQRPIANDIGAGARKVVDTVKKNNPLDPSTKDQRDKTRKNLSNIFNKNKKKATTAFQKNPVGKGIGNAVKNVTRAAANVATNSNVRSAASGFNKVRNALPTAADFAPTSQSGLGLGGTLSGRSLKGIGNAVNAGLSADRFEKSDVKTYSKAGLGQRKKNLQYINRGRRINPETGEPINEPKDTSFKGQAKNFIKDKLGIRDKVDEPKKPDEDKGANKVTTTGNIPDDDNSGSKVTTGKGKPNPSSGSAAASTSDDSKTASTDASPTARQPRKIRKRFNLFKKDPEPDKRVRIDEPKTDPSKLNKVKGFKDKPEPKQENIPGIGGDNSAKSEPQKKPRKQRTPEQQKAINDKSRATRAANKKKKDDAIGQGTIPGLEDRNQSRTNAAEKSGVKITGDTQPEITGTKKDKVTSSDNVDKTSKPVEKPVEKPKSNEVAITDAREKKTPGKKRGPKKGSTNVRTLARQNREKKQQETQAKERLASAVKDQEQKDKKNPIEQAKQDSRTSTALTGSTLERNRKELAKMLNLGSGSSSGKKKNTQLKDMSDDELARQEQDSETGKYRRNATSTNKKKKINPNASKSTGKKNVKKTFTNKKKDEKTKTESFSHWREEFIWETDKKYPEKVKEIKPMTGKNTITINPEDETSKYKRGY